MFKKFFGAKTQTAQAVIESVISNCLKGEALQQGRGTLDTLEQHCSSLCDKFYGGDLAAGELLLTTLLASPEGLIEGDGSLYHRINFSLFTLASDSKGQAKTLAILSLAVVSQRFQIVKYYETDLEKRDFLKALAYAGDCKSQNALEGGIFTIYPHVNSDVIDAMGVSRNPNACYKLLDILVDDAVSEPDHRATAMALIQLDSRYPTLGLMNAKLSADGDVRVIDKNADKKGVRILEALRRVSAQK